jgi:hypothetical protein
VAGCCECGDESLGSCATELVNLNVNSEQDSCAIVECESACTGGGGASESANMMISHKQPKKKSSNRNGDDKHLKIEFYWTGDPFAPTLLCFVCSETLPNDAIKRSKLSQY